MKNVDMNIFFFTGNCGGKDVWKVESIRCKNLYYTLGFKLSRLLK